LANGFIAEEEGKGFFVDENVSINTPDLDKYEIYEEKLKDYNDSDIIDKDDIPIRIKDVISNNYDENDDANGDKGTNSDKADGGNDVHSSIHTNTLNSLDFDMAISDELSNTSGYLYDDSNNVYVDRQKEGHFLNSKNMKFDNSIISDIPNVIPESSNKISKNKKKSTEILNKFRNLKDDNYDNTISNNLFGIKGKGQLNENDNHNISIDKIMKNQHSDNHEKRLKSRDNRFGQNLNVKAVPKRGLNRKPGEVLLKINELKINEQKFDDKEIEVNKNEVNDSFDFLNESDSLA